MRSDPETCARAFNRVGVPVDAEHLDAPVAKGRRVPAIPQRTVHGAMRAGGQLQHGVEQDGEVVFGHRVSWEGATNANTPSAKANGVSGAESGADGARTRDLRSDSAAL